MHFQWSTFTRLEAIESDAQMLSEDTRSLTSCGMVKVVACQNVL
jgi:hypothetical protein